jgi:hypothetical protein
VGAENGVTSCDLRIFMDQATEPITAQNPDVGIRSGRNRMPGRRPLLQRPMRPMRVVVPGVLSQDPAAMLVVLAATAGLLVRPHFAPGHLAAPTAGMLAVLQGISPRRAGREQRPAPRGGSQLTASQPAPDP